MKRLKSILNIDDDSLNVIARSYSDAKRSLSKRKEMREKNKTIIESAIPSEVLSFLRGNGNKVVCWPVFEGIAHPNGDMLKDHEDPYDGCEPVDTVWVIDLATYDVQRNVDDLYYEYCTLDFEALNFLLEVVQGILIGSPV